MTTLIAIHTIIVPDPQTDLIFTGRYDQAGNPIMKKAAVEVKAGSFFEMLDPAEVAWLIEEGAAREPSDHEILLGRAVKE